MHSFFCFSQTQMPTLPGPHMSQFTARRADWCPGSQRTHGVLAFLSRSANPGAHAVHVCALLSEYSPSPHGWHFSPWSLYSPVLQCAHESRAWFGCSPLGHAAQLVLFAAENFPLGQRVHAVSASESWSERPAEHGVQLVVPRPENVPGEHRWHGVAASESWSCLPAGHSVHKSEASSLQEPAAQVTHAVEASPSYTVGLD